MQDYISERVIREGLYIMETGDTVRAAAEYFHVSKSTVHTEVTL